MLSSEVLWGLCQENLQYCRHHENQRRAITGFAIAVASALASFAVSDKNLDLWDLPVAALLIAVGVFGAVLSAKHYERFAYHYERFRALRAELEAQVPGLNVERINDVVDTKHYKHFPRLAHRSLSNFWLAIHFFIVAVGVAIAVGALACRFLGACTGR